MKSYFASALITEQLLDNNFVRLTKSFKYYSNYLSKTIIIPRNFICDLESVPLLKSSSNHAGLIHDYFCRKDSIPILTKQQAATLYFEAQSLRDSLTSKTFLSKLLKLLTRHFKTLTVRIFPNYFHKHYVLSTLNELKGLKGN